ncbi:MAG: alginate export family protein [Bacteroidia bacterium]|nr:alginate export family protein [Bacteroidia bacterium]
MKTPILTILMLFSVFGIKSQIQLLRYNDDFTSLRSDSIHKKGFDKLKHIKLSKRSNISFGGEIREQYQYYQNPNFGDLPPGYEQVSSGQVWQRAMLHTNLELGTKARVFAQTGSTFRFLNPNPLTPEIDENQLSLHQAFIDLRLSKKWATRIGRQEISYGNHSLITFREGPNTRLAFDAVVFKRNTDKEKLDFFIMTPVISKPGVFDDESFKDLVIGMYKTEIFVPGKFMLDYYSMSLNSKRRQYDYTAGEEYRQTYGIRLYSENQRFNYELEANYQYGKFNQLKISAYNISADMNYKLHDKSGFVVGLSGNYTSGDKNNEDAELNTYNSFFSKPQYGLTAPISAVNIINANPYVRIRPGSKLDIYAGANFMWRQSNQDGIYSPGAIQVRPDHSDIFDSKEKQLGTLMTLEALYSVNKHLSFALDLGYFVAGKYVKETGNGKNIFYSSFKINYKF